MSAPLKASGKGKLPPPPNAAKAKGRGETLAHKDRVALPSGHASELFVASAEESRVLTAEMLYDEKLAEATVGIVDDGPVDALKLACFDFDRTLAAVHLYETLVHHAGGSDDGQLLKAYWQLFEKENEDEMVFGGPERLRMLHSRLSGLCSAGVSLFVVTKGSGPLVSHTLQRCGLRGFFRGITDANPKQQTVQVLMNTCFEGRLRADQAVLVDDTVGNLRDASTQEELRGLVSPKVFGLFLEQSAGYARSFWQSHFEVGVISVSGQGYCRAMLVDGARGVTEEQLDSLVHHTLAAPQTLGA